MARYGEIVGGSWEQKSVFAESVPHLLHQDMAYLWTLEQQLDQRPKTWITKIEAWKLLLRLFFLDQVAISTEELRTPLLDVTEPFGIRHITWLRNRSSGQAVGVLSPTVIVRPLPDFADADLDRWKVELRDNDRDFRHLMYVAVKDLERVAGTTPFATRIAAILKREFTPAETAQRPPGGRAVEVPLLHRFTWERRDGEQAPVGTVSLAVRSGKERDIAEYVPRCASCGWLLLQEENAPPIQVDGPVVRIHCVNAQCEHRDQELPLDVFGVWLRSAATAVVWSPEHIPPMPDLALPPDPAVAGSELQYKWNAAAIGGERIRRFLRLRFPDRRVESVPLMSIFFTRLLVPGDFDAFDGSAVLPAWSDALDVSTPAFVRASSEQGQVEFRDLKVRGWPTVFNKFYKALSLQRAPELAVGLFPDPSVVGTRWKWYRAFVQGAGSQDYEVSCTDGRRILKSFASTESGVPQSISVRSIADPAAGVSYLPRRHEPEEEAGGNATASLAIDFGTTNTLVYWQPPTRTQAQRLVARANTHGLDPRTIAAKALWLADNKSWREADVLASFLPGPNYRKGATDLYIVPSEVWRIGNEHLIRWGFEPPDAKARQVSQFKWEIDQLGAEGFTPTRVAFLRELILQVLPVVMDAFDPARVTDVNIGFAFPLAFEHAAREQFRQMLESVAENLGKLTGLNIATRFSINESKACVNAFGSFNGETFLVADMGGGTLDVALFSYDPDGTMRQHQMGSLRYAGERCVEALAVQLAMSGNSAPLREAIARGESAKKYGKQATEKMVTQFATIAFEFLRIMVAAYRAKSESATEPVNVVLIGNGWHLIEAFSSQVGARGRKNVYLDVYADMVEAIGDPALVFYNKAPLPEFPSSKHLVVAGALQNVTAENATDELAEENVTWAMLPAGRSMDVDGTDIPWWSLVGEGLKLPVGLDLGTAGKAKIHIRIDEMPVEGSAAWMKRLANSVGASKHQLPYPTEAELLRELRDDLVSTPPRLRRGPLQLILELTWSQALNRQPGTVQ